MNKSFKLTGEFKKALDLIKQGKNIFITGKAGTGKSTFLRYLQDEVLGDEFVYLAPTGVAAVNIGGATIHSFFGFTPKTTLAQLKQEVKKLLKKRKAFSKIKGFVIDEISMVSAELLDCIDLALKTVLKNPDPFGGKQMIFIGDLYQLPPVIKRKERSLFEQLYQTPYFFSARVFQDFDCELIEFSQIFRQRDETFIAILNQVREAKIDDAALTLLNQRLIEKEDYKKLSDYVFLTPFKKVAEEINKKRLEELPGREYFYEAIFEGEVSADDLPVPEILILKKGARVMLAKNDPHGRFINGSLGTVISLNKEQVSVQLDEGEKVVVEPEKFSVYQYFYDKEKELYRKEEVGFAIQFPLILAWSITIHKSQGKTLEKVIVDLERGIFAPGQFYVAISRCQTLDKLYFTKAIKPSYIFNDWRAIKLLVEFQYKRAEKDLSLSEKRLLFKRLIEKNQPVEIVYLKPSGEKTKRQIKPIAIKKSYYGGKEFEGLVAYCFLRKEERIFKLERILTIKQ